MPAFRIAFLFLSWGCFYPGLAQAQSGDAPTNAAIQYWQAFSQMPDLNAEQEALVDNWFAVPLDAAAQKVIAESQNALKYLHRGASLSQCDWGLDYNDGVMLLLPHLAKARSLARLAGLHARHEFAQGNMKSGQSTVRAIMVLGRHVGRDPIMISLLVRHLIEGIAVDALAPMLPQTKIPYADSKSMYESLPPSATMQQVMFTEKKFMTQWIIIRLKEKEQDQAGSGRALWHNLLDGSTASDELKNKPIPEVIRLLEDLVPVYDQLAVLVALPPAEFDAQYPAFRDKTKSANAAAGVILPATEMVLAKERTNLARVSMLLAAIAVAEGGEQKLQEIRDPFGDGPFEFRRLDPGFELQSDLKADGQPVTLLVGQLPKKS